jgi:CheY-like chemotaxis protein
LSVDLNINHLYKEIYSAERFEKVSLLITDYDMPGLTGLDLCQKLNNCYIYRILLTGIADESTAIRAFNDGFIEQFMRKSDLSIVDSLQGLINKSQHNYFSYISKNYSDLFNSNNKSLDILEDPTFIDLFNQILKRENIIEYYLLDSNGSFLMLTNSGEVSALYITNLEHHEEIYNFAKDENCPTEILKELQNKNKTLWFYQSQIKDNIDWKEYLISLDTINLKNQVLYYSYTKTVPFINKKEVVSFNQYKKNN